MGFRVVEHVGVGPPGRGRILFLQFVAVTIVAIGIGALGHLAGFGDLAFRQFVLAGFVLAFGAFILGVVALLRAAIGCVLVRVVFAVVRLGRARYFSEFQRLDQIADTAAKLLLILGQRFQLLHHFGAATFNQRAP